MHTGPCMHRGAREVVHGERGPREVLGRSWGGRGEIVGRSKYLLGRQAVVSEGARQQGAQLLVLREAVEDLGGRERRVLEVAGYTWRLHVAVARGGCTAPGWS